MDWWRVLGKSPLMTKYEIELIIYSSILCSDFAIKRIDEPFVLPTDDRNEWAL
jgi:hypothetical protein